MKIYIINGPNINMLGIREPEIYGSCNYNKLTELCSDYASELGIEAVIYQSNHEGDLVDKIQEAYFEGANGIIINPGAYTHTSIAILDAIKATSLPTVEVHVSDIEKREDFRQISYVSLAAKKTVKGHGTHGYLEAIDYLYSLIGEKNES